MGAPQLHSYYYGVPPLVAVDNVMPSLNFVYRGCIVDIQIGERATIWNVTIRVTPRDGIELIEPFGTRELRLAKGDSLDVIQGALIEEVRLAIDNRLVGC